jgi:hypothetical protein
LTLQPLSLESIQNNPDEFTKTLKEFGVCVVRDNKIKTNMLGMSKNFFDLSSSEKMQLQKVPMSTENPPISKHSPSPTRVNGVPPAFREEKLNQQKDLPEVPEVLESQYGVVSNDTLSSDASSSDDVSDLGRVPSSSSSSVVETKKIEKKTADVVVLKRSPSPSRVFVPSHPTSVSPVYTPILLSRPRPPPDNKIYMKTRVKIILNVQLCF